jgi:hypothetical protein
VSVIVLGGIVDLAVVDAVGMYAHAGVVPGVFSVTYWLMFLKNVPNASSGRGM